MTDLTAEAFLAACTIDSEVFALCPDYRAMLLVVEGLDQAVNTHEAAGARGSNTTADDLIDRAESHARELLADSKVDQLPHIAAWREAYRAFGAKPSRTRNSLEALTRRADNGLPRVNALTDIYNGICVLHQIPLGGEDLACYNGPAHLTRATGGEDFDTSAHGETVIEHPETGEVIWRDNTGVTCRRWNWRQGKRTALTDDTNTALFIMDALGPLSDDELNTAADELIAALSILGTEVRATKRLITSANSAENGAEDNAVDTAELSPDTP